MSSLSDFEFVTKSVADISTVIVCSEGGSVGTVVRSFRNLRITSSNLIRVALRFLYRALGPSILRDGVTRSFLFFLATAHSSSPFRWPRQFWLPHRFHLECQSMLFFAKEKFVCGGLCSRGNTKYVPRCKGREITANQE